MAFNVVQTATEFQICSPFTGAPAETADDGPNQIDPSLFFISYGNAGGGIDYAHPRFLEMASKQGMNIDLYKTEVDSVIERLHIPNLIVLEVDMGWNGVNWYGFYPTNEFPA